MKDNGISLKELYTNVVVPLPDQPIHQHYVMLNLEINRLLVELYANYEEADTYDFIINYLRWVKLNHMKIDEVVPIIEEIEKAYDADTQPAAYIDDLTRLYCAAEEGQVGAIPILAKCAIIFLILQKCGLKFVFE